MKIIKLLFLFLTFCPLAFGQTCTPQLVVTGFGYQQDSNGHVTEHDEFPKGEFCIPNGFTYIEVANQAALDAIPIYQAPVSPVNAFSTDTFVQQLAQTSLITDPNILPFYSVLKDLTFYKNFQQLANMIAGFLQAGILNQQEVDALDTVFENQQINLDSYNAQINVAY
jgi:hypothetical protein